MRKTSCIPILQSCSKRSFSVVYSKSDKLIIADSVHHCHIAISQIIHKLILASLIGIDFDFSIPDRVDLILASLIGFRVPETCHIDYFDPHRSHFP